MPQEPHNLMEKAAAVAHNAQTRALNKEDALYWDNLPTADKMKAISFAEFCRDNPGHPVPVGAEVFHAVVLEICNQWRMD